MSKQETWVAIGEGLGGLAVFGGAIFNAGGWVRRRIAPTGDAVHHATDFDIVPVWFDVAHDGHAVRLTVHARAINHTLSTVTLISGHIPDFYLSSGAIERVDLIGHHTLPTRSTIEVTFSRKLDADEVVIAESAMHDQLVSAKLTFRADWRKWSKLRVFAQYTPEVVRGAIRLAPA